MQGAIVPLVTGLWLLVWVWAAITRDRNPYRRVVCGPPLPIRQAALARAQ
jgi:hypothetical protein